MRTVGSTDGTVDISPNQEIVKLQSSALLNSYSVIETGFDYQVKNSISQTLFLHDFDCRTLETQLRALVRFGGYRDFFLILTAKRYLNAN